MIYGEVGDNARVEPYAIIRPGVRVGRWAFVRAYTDVREDVGPFLVVGPDGIEGVNGKAMRREFSAEQIRNIKAVYRALERGEVPPENEFTEEIMDAQRV